MANYSFEELLSPLDFEHLAQDLLSEDLGIELTSFSEGKDGGIDLRYSDNKAENIIVQCKRVKSITRKQLEEEAKKIKKLKSKPKCYYLVISSDLSVAKVDLVKEVFKEWIVGDKNIYQRNRLNNLLDKYPIIHRKHYKLWLNSSNVFSSIINQPLFERANALIATIKNDYKFYVKNEIITKAIEILNRNQFIIISGIPGIGKTTLAKMLLWEYLLQGFEVIEIRKIAEGEQILVENTNDKQVFYFDDFLGENFFKYDVIEGRSNDIVQFIKRIMNNKNKVLIMTTREYILHQAKEKYEKLNTNEFDIYKYTLDLSSYSKKIKALILYNHLYYSGISHDYIRNILTTKSYKIIISHKNYSPRIIEQMTVFLNDVNAEEYANTFIRNLNHPFGIWNKAFNSQISIQSKFILFVLLTIGERILLSDFKSAIIYFFKSAKDNLQFQFSKFDLKIYLKELEDSFIRFEITKKRNHFVDFQNPSIKDFLLNIVRDDKDLIIQLLESVFYFNQLVYILNYLIVRHQKDKLLNALIKDVIMNKFDLLGSNNRIFTTGSEYENNQTSIDKINKLVPYLKSINDSELLDFIVGKFQLINIQKLDFIQERNYIKILDEFNKIIPVDYGNLVSSIYNNISWFDNLKNFFSIRKLNIKAFDKYISENKSEFEEKINDIIDKEIEYSDNEDALESLSADINSNSKFIEEFTDIDISYYDTVIDEKIGDIQSEKESEEIEELEIENFDDQNDIVEFDEDKLFREELF